MYRKVNAFQAVSSLAILTLASGGFLGCNLSPSGSAVSSDTHVAITGQLQGGQQPVSGATIQLYAANSSTSKGAASALLTSTVQTDANGNFSITRTYTCPAANPMVYLVATGGNPGLSGTVNNTDLSLMAALGGCNSLTSSTFISVNELTTVAAVEALAPFMADFAHIGSASTNAAGLAGAFNTAASLVNTSTGRLQTNNSGMIAPAATLNTLADILAACVNTSGGASGSATACGNLLKYAGAGIATDTIGAMLAITQAPSQNVAQLFALVTSTAPFAPALTAAPPDFSVATSVALPAGATNALLAIDSAQHVWVYTGQQANTSNGIAYYTGTINVYDTNTNLLFTVQPNSGGLNLPVAMVGDPSGNMWTLNSTLTLSKFSANGSPLSPSGGFPIPIANTTPVSSGTTTLPNLPPDLMSIDTSGNVWTLNTGSTSNCYVEVNNSGTVITPAAGTFCASAGNVESVAIATDTTNDAWLLGPSAVAKVNSSGALASSGTTTNGCFQVPASTGGVGGAEGLTSQLIYDKVNNHLWGFGQVNVGLLNSDGSQILCDYRGANLPVIPFTTATNTQNSLYIYAAAADGAGNVWFATYGDQVTNNPAGYLTVTTYGGLNAISPAGKILTPFNASAGPYGYQSGSLSSTTTGQITTYTATGYIFDVNTDALAIDSNGNIWALAYTGYPSALVLIKIPGLATPKTAQ